MQTGRDLGQVEFWQASLERSLARRDQPRRRRAGSVRPVVGAGGISAAALLAVTLPGVLHGRTGPSHQSRAALRLGPSAQRLPSLQPRPSAHLLGTRRHAASRPVLVASTRRPAAPVTQTTAATVTHSVPAVTRPRSQTHPSSPRATTATTLVRHRAGTSAPAAARPQSDPSHPVPPRPPVPSHPAPASPGYVDPLAQASVTSERIDQGVDYSGSGTLGAIGRATVTYVGTTNTGWPGAFIEFRLLSGPDSGRYVYYAESVVPAAGLHVGQTVNAGQAMATITGGIEIGWGANIGTETYAAAMGQWSAAQAAGSAATPAGRSFSALVASLGGPPGIVEG